jgi:hypothetical protein
LKIQTHAITRAVIFAFSLLATQSTFAATETGSRALALASLVATASPVLSRHEKHIMKSLFGGHSSSIYPLAKKISVKAYSVVCRASNVDITSRWCKLTFGAASVSLTGRDAHELFATLTEAGVRQLPRARFGKSGPC